MSPTTIAVLGIIIFLVLIFLSVNIGLALMLVGFVGYGVTLNWKAAMVMLQTTPATQASSYSFVVSPLFILMGNFAFNAGLSGNLYDAGTKWLSRLPGNLACGTVAACAGFGAICGSCAATCATMATIAMPEMQKAGYDDKLSTGSIAMGGTLGVLIPPSTPMILYGIMAEASIGQLFAAGILPGIMMATLCIITIVVLCKTHKNYAPAPCKTPWRVRFASLKGLIGVAVLFLVTLGGMFAGIFSVNQSAAVGAFLALLLMATKHALNWKNFFEALKTTVATFAMTFLIVIGASVFCKFLTATNLPTNLANYIGTLPVSRYVILILITIVYIFLGMIMDEIPMIMLTVPIFLPIIKTLGWDPIWFGVYVVMVMEMGAISPPVGLNCFILNGVAKNVSLATIYRGILPFMVTLIVGIVIHTAFPQIALILPSMMAAG